ncbi:hypothetical protein PG991_006362 [Apiospora marii]|uniref:Uncharacterized protein n=1 Tax=Apiospora marii TaxID=335849 RepID=A0ABR1SBR8_9PEZI
MSDTIRSRRLFTVGVLLRLCILSIAEGQVCYLPDGTVAQNHMPCSKAGGACCYSADDAHRDACYSNGLCQSLWFGHIYRGACTDQAWGNSCPNVCIDDNSRDYLHICPDKAGVWCCNLVNSTADCCSEGKGISWNNATLVNYALEPRQTDYTFEMTEAYITVPAATDQSSIGPRIVTSCSSSSSSPATATPSTAMSTPVPTPTDTCPPGPSVDFTAAGLGAGLGVPLIAVSAALLWMLAKQRYHRSQTTTSTNQVAQQKNMIISVQHQADDMRCGSIGGQRNWDKPELTPAVATPRGIATQSFPSGRITSAYPCLGVPAKTVSVTYTAPTAITTSTVQAPATTTVTVSTQALLTTTTTNIGVQTVWVTAPTPANLDFEQGPQESTWEWSASDQGRTLGNVQTPDLHNKPTWAFNAQSAQNAGGVVAINTNYYHRFYLRAGADVPHLPLGQDDGARSPLTNGTALGNDWYYYSMDFVVSQANQGYCNVYTLFLQRTVPGSHSVDNYAIDRLN